MNLEALTAIQPSGGGLSLSGTQGIYGGSLGVGATFASTISVEPKIAVGNELKIWATEAGLYGLPSKAAMKFSPSTSPADLYNKLEEFAQAECDKAAQGLSGESSVAHMGLSAGMLANMIEWSFAVKSVSFEGDDIPRDAPHPLSEWLKDGEAFQVHGDLKQDVSAMHQTALGMAAGKGPDVAGIAAQHGRTVPRGGVTCVCAIQ